MSAISLSPTDPPSGGTLQDAEALLRAIVDTDEASAGYRREILAFIAKHDDALYRTCLAGHMTGSALVVDAARERVLLMLHAKLGMWLQPGGHADGEGHLAAVALREAREETGIVGLRVAEPPIDCDVHSIPARPDEPEHLHLDIRFVVIAPADAVVQGNHESHELRWVTLSELLDLASDCSLRRLARAGLEAAQTL
jgi:8-oxo-dGTP pyrophosphatase MutT (NUDIX family)